MNSDAWSLAEALALENVTLAKKGTYKIYVWLCWLRHCLINSDGRPSRMPSNVRDFHRTLQRRWRGPWAMSVEESMQSKQGKSTAAVIHVCWQRAGNGGFSSQAMVGGNSCPKSSESHRATTKLWLQMKLKSGCFRAAFPAGSAASLLPAARTVRPCSEPWLGVQTAKLMSFTDTGRCGEVGWLLALSVPWLPNLRAGHS